MHARWQVLAGFSAGVICKSSRGSRSRGPSATAKRHVLFHREEHEREWPRSRSTILRCHTRPRLFPSIPHPPPSLAHRFPFLYASPHRRRTAANSPGAVPSKARAKTFFLLHRLSPFLEFIIVHTLGQPVMKKNIIISSIIIIIIIMDWARIAEIAGPLLATWTRYLGYLRREDDAEGWSRSFVHECPFNAHKALDLNPQNENKRGTE